MAGGRFDKLRHKLLLSFVTLVLMFVGLEIVLRIIDEDVDRTANRRWSPTGESALHIRSPNPKLVYELRPNARVWVPALERTIRTNADGFRDGPFVRPKPSGTYRILAVGDSVTWGWAQEPEDTYPK